MNLIEVMEEFVDEEVGLDVGTFEIVDGGNEIWYGFKQRLTRGSKEDWKEGAKRLVEKLELNGFGYFEVVFVNFSGATVRRIND